MSIRSIILGGALAAAASSPVSAALLNAGFEAGDLTGWSHTGDLVAVVADSYDFAFETLFTPTEGDNLVELTAGDSDVYTVLSQSFTLTFASQLSFDAAFLAFDEVTFNDDAYVRVYGAGRDEVLFEASVAAVDNYGHTPWARFTSGLLGPGDYVFEAGVRNVGDGDPDYSSKLLIDNAALAVPEPATWAVMLLGFGALGAVARRRRAHPEVIRAGCAEAAL